MMIAPQTADELTLEWVQHVLDENTFDCELSSFDVDPEFNPASLMCVVVRVLLGYNSDCGGPNSIIVKFPTDNADTRSLWLANGIYEKERRIYQLFGEHTDLAVPRFFGMYLGTEQGSAALVLEDLIPSTAGNHITGCTIEDARSLVSQLSAIHSRFWGDNRVPVADVDQLIVVAKKYIDTGWQPFIERFESDI